MTDTDATFIEWLSELLSERRQLVQLLQTRQRAKILANFEAVTAAEERISALLLDGLNLSLRESPNRAGLINVIAALPSRFGSLPMIDAPGSVFNDALVPGFGLNLVPTLRERLLDLTCDLDSVIARKKAA
jgi:hypothetical protein